MPQTIRKARPKGTTAPVKPAGKRGSVKNGKASHTVSPRRPAVPRGTKLS